MLDLEELDEQREKATIDKADLFDFYHANWSKLLNEIQQLRSQLKSNQSEECWECGSDGTNGNPFVTCHICGRLGTMTDKEFDQ